MKDKVMKCLNALGVAVFVYFAWLQREDDNPEVYVEPSMLDVCLWVGFYGLVAGVFLMAFFRRFPAWLYGLVLALGIFHLATTLPGVWENLVGGDLEMAKESMSPERAEVELSREFFGVVIAFVGAGLAWVQRPKKGNRE